MIIWDCLQSMFWKRFLHEGLTHFCLSSFAVNNLDEENKHSVLVENIKEAPQAKSECG
jgi:hypothetical protein